MYTYFQRIHDIFIVLLLAYAIQTEACGWLNLDQFWQPSGIRVAGSESYEGMGVSSESQVSVSDNEITVEDLNCETPNADCSKATGFPTDLGFFIRPMSKEERQFLISSPPCQPIVENMSGKCFPKKVQSGHSRSFQSSWYTKTLGSGGNLHRKWLTDSTVKDAMLCLPCFLFSLETGVTGKYRYSNEWAEDGVSNWKRGLEKICDHEKSESHLICSEKLENL